MHYCRVNDKILYLNIFNAKALSFQDAKFYPSSWLRDFVPLRSKNMMRTHFRLYSSLTRHYGFISY